MEKSILFKIAVILSFILKALECIFEANVPSLAMCPAKQSKNLVLRELKKKKNKKILILIIFFKLLYANI